MDNFWKPKYKWQLIEWFKSYRPAWKVGGWTKEKLYAVYYKERSKPYQHINRVEIAAHIAM